MIPELSDLKKYIPVFETHIYPIYNHHQNTFDSGGIHGVLHISRSIIAAKTLSESLSQLDKATDFEDIFYAVAFHDSGRISNGPDKWEADSANKCYNYLLNRNKLLGYADYVSSLISKHNKEKDYNYFCVYDADVLEIMRPCGHGGLAGFQKQHLKLLNTMPKWLDSFILEWWQFILETEAHKQELSGPNSLARLIELANDNPKKYPNIYDAVQ